ncbi:MAG TPA: hypothetical protein VNH20_04170 [Candidatus Dormibacteraeota bacterium]|nr:hypothetical protein [Candidatus Dormibacteraeota bacterium]
MSPFPGRHLVCPSGCRGGRFEILGAPVFVDTSGRYLDHRDRQASFRCAECQAVAIDLAAAASARARDTGDPPPPTLRCPACGDTLLAPEERDEAVDLECPECGATFSWDEGRPSLLGTFSEPPPEPDLDG